MAGELGQWLESQGEARELAKAKSSSRRWTAAIVLVPLLVFVAIAFQWDFQAIIWVAVFLGGAAWLWSEWPKTKAKKVVKVGINEGIAGALGLSYSHEAEADRAFALAKACRLVPRHDKASFEDRWTGAFGEIPFTLYEAHLEERRGSGKNRRWVTVFRGIVMSVGYRERFHGTTLLVRDNAFRKFWGGKKDCIEVDGMQLDYAAMSHPEFEDVFDIYTSDQVEARTLIDPLYVERLIALERSYRGEDVGTIFNEGQLVVALKTGNMFESGHIEASEDRRMVERTVDQFARLADLARTLNEREPLTGRRG